MTLPSVNGPEPDPVLLLEFDAIQRSLTALDEVLKPFHGLRLTREVAIAITHLETGQMWLMRRLHDLSGAVGPSALHP